MRSDGGRPLMTAYPSPGASPEYLHQNEARPKTFFATHYHELNELEGRLERVRNFHITHREVGHKVVFLRKLAPGGSTHSFGIHVARMAGMPPALIARAEGPTTGPGGPGNCIRDRGASAKAPIVYARAPMRRPFQKIRALPDRSWTSTHLTPIEALLKLGKSRHS